MSTASQLADARQRAQLATEDLRAATQHVVDARRVLDAALTGHAQARENARAAWAAEEKLEREWLAEEQKRLDRTIEARVKRLEEQP